MDGEITSTVDASEIPTEDNQSNFGTGFGYQYGINNSIEIQMEDGTWFVFQREGTEYVEPTENDEKTVLCPLTCLCFFNRLRRKRGRGYFIISSVCSKYF